MSWTRLQHWYRRLARKKRDAASAGAGGRRGAGGTFKRSSTMDRGGGAGDGRDRSNAGVRRTALPSLRNPAPQQRSSFRGIGSGGLLPISIPLSGPLASAPGKAVAPVSAPLSAAYLEADDGHDDSVTAQDNHPSALEAALTTCPAGAGSVGGAGATAAAGSGGPLPFAGDSGLLCSGLDPAAIELMELEAARHRAKAMRLDAFEAASSAVRIVFTALQLLQFFGEALDIPWPERAANGVSWIRVFNLDVVTIPRFACLAPEVRVDVV